MSGCPADTDPRIDEMQIELLRQAGPVRRLELACQLSAMVWNAARAAVDRYHPYETEDERDRIFLAECYGAELAEKFIAYRQEKLGRRDGRLA